MDNRYPEKGTREYHLKMLKKLAGWLRINPKNSPLVAEECEAVQWAIEELEKENG